MEFFDKQPRVVQVLDHVLGMHDVEIASRFAGRHGCRGRRSTPQQRSGR